HRSFVLIVIGRAGARRCSHLPVSPHPTRRFDARFVAVTAQLPGRSDMATAADLVDAVNAGDAARVRAILVDDGALVAARDGAGVSVLMLARYRFDREVTDALLAADP